MFPVRYELNFIHYLEEIQSLKGTLTVEVSHSCLHLVFLNRLQRRDPTRQNQSESIRNV
jgi:hypothetical protein